MAHDLIFSTATSITNYIGLGDSYVSKQIKARSKISVSSA